MAIKEMTMHRLLAELKTYDDRINKLVVNSKYIDTTKNKEDSEKLKVTLKANLQSIKALISNKKNLESAKLKSNAQTTVIIGSKSYTVADAIKRKSDIMYEKNLLVQLVKQYNHITSSVEEYNNNVKYSAEKIALELYKEDSNKNNLFDEFVNNYMENNSAKVIDPNNLHEIIKSMEEDIRDFITEVDAVLSESNAVTMVSVELED